MIMLPLPGKIILCPFLSVWIRLPAFAQMSLILMESEHLKGQVGPRVRDMTFFYNQRRPVGALREWCHGFGPLNI